MSQIKENFASNDDIDYPIEYPIESKQNFKVSMLIVDFMICMIAGGYLLITSPFVKDMFTVVGGFTGGAGGQAAKTAEEFAQTITGLLKNDSPINKIFNGLIGGMGRKAPAVTGMLLITTGLHSLFLYNRITKGHHPIVPSEENEELQAGSHPTTQEINRHLMIRIAITAYIMIVNGLFPTVGSLLGSLINDSLKASFEKIQGQMGVTTIVTGTHLGLLIAAILTDNHKDANKSAPKSQDKDGNEIPFCSNLLVNKDGKKLDKVHKGVYICNKRDL